VWGSAARSSPRFLRLCSTSRTRELALLASPQYSDDSPPCERMLKSISHQTAADLLHPNVRRCRLPSNRLLRLRLRLADHCTSPHSSERARWCRQDLDLTCGEEMDTSFSSELSQEVSSNDGMTDMSSCNLVSASMLAVQHLHTFSHHKMACAWPVKAKTRAGGESSSHRHSRAKTGRKPRPWSAVVAIRLPNAVTCATCFKVHANCGIRAPPTHTRAPAANYGPFAASGSGHTYPRLGSSLPRPTMAGFAAEGHSSLPQSSRRALLRATRGRPPRRRELLRCRTAFADATHRQQPAINAEPLASFRCNNVLANDSLRQRRAR
jgi:hypothetical protein